MRTLFHLLILSTLTFQSSALGEIVGLEFAPVPVKDTDPRLPAAYEMLRGRAYGEVNPEDSHNTLIQDIELAPRNARGRVEYATTFTIYRPIKGAKRSGILVYEVVNRGASIANRDYETGDTFVQSGWQGDLPFGGNSISGAHGETIQVPIARCPDGTSVTGPVLARFENIRQGTKTLPIRAASGYATSGTPPFL